MNKKKLLELAHTLRVIAEENDIFSFEQWHENGWLNCKFRYKHELKPPPDPYAALKEAHAAGKTIQCKHWSESHWFDLAEPQFTAAPSSYRIKPEPRKVPLGPDDVMPGCVISLDREHLAAVIATSAYSLSTLDTTRTWKRLMEDNLQINRSVPLTGKWDKDAWEPCYKLIEE